MKMLIITPRITTKKITEKTLCRTAVGGRGRGASAGRSAGEKEHAKATFTCGPAPSRRASPEFSVQAHAERPGVPRRRELRM